MSGKFEFYSCSSFCRRFLFAVYLDLFFLISAVGLPSRVSAAMCIEQYIIMCTAFSVYRFYR